MADPRKSALEIDRLQKEITALGEKVKRREDRIRYLESKRSKIEKENTHLREQRKLKTYPGFRLLCEHDPEYRDIFDVSLMLPEDGSISSLASLAQFMQPTGAMPSILREHVWQPSTRIREVDEYCDFLDCLNEATAGHNERSLRVSGSPYEAVETIEEKEPAHHIEPRHFTQTIRGGKSRRQHF